MLTTGPSPEFRRGPSPSGDGSKPGALAAGLLSLLLVLSCVAPAFSAVAAADDRTRDPFVGEPSGASSLGLDAAPLDPEPPGDAGDEPAAKRSVTLITGHTVTVVDRPEGRFYDFDADALRRVTTARGTYVFPEGIDFERFDRDLFNVDLLIAQNLTDAESDSIPVIVRSEPGERRGAVSARALDAAPNVVVTSRLESIGAEAGVVPKRDASAVSARVSSADRVERIYLDRKIAPALDDADGLIGAGDARTRYDVSGRGVTVSVVDSGVDATHPDLRGRIAAAKDFTNDGTTADLNGHGTHVAGIVAGDGSASDGRYVGVAPNATLLNGRVLMENGAGYTSWVINAIEWSVDRDADVISLSIGAGTRADRTKDPLANAVEAATDAGVVVVTSAGNDGGDGYGTVTSPGVADGAITVGASTKGDELAGFSSRGPTPGGYLKPDILAPGRGIVSARAEGTGTGYWSNDRYTRKSGTSMAAPVVSGAAALLLERHPDWSPERVKGALTSTADPLPSSDAYQQGAGRLDAAAALGTELVVSDTTLDLGTYSSNTMVRRPVGIRNLGDEPRTVNVSATSARVGTGEADDVWLNETTVTVAPGETGWVALVADTNTTPGYHAGRIAFDSGHTAVFGYERTNEPPTAAFEFAPEAPRTGQTVAFDGSGSADPDGTVDRYEWDLDGDGSFEARGKTVERTYAETGTRRVTLRVVDDLGDAATVARKIVVERNEPPVVDLVTNASGDVEAGSHLEFDASGSTDDTGIDAYEWDFDGDGAPDERGAVVERSFARVGDRRVALTVRDTEGNEGTAEATVTVVDTVPPAVELVDLSNGTGRANPGDGPLRTNGSLAVGAAADGTPGDATAVNVTLDAAFANYRVTAPATLADGVWRATFDSADVPDDGRYAVSATATDAGGNVATNETAVVFDREPPRLGVSVDRVDATTARVNVSATEPLAADPAVDVTGPSGNRSVALARSGDGWTGTFALDDPAEGEYRVAATGADRTGNAGEATATTRFEALTTDNGTATTRVGDAGTFVRFDTATDVENESVALTARGGESARLDPAFTGISFLDGRLSETLARNLSRATIGIPVPDELPGDVSADEVSIRYYDATNGTWDARPTDLREVEVDGSTRRYWVANVTHFSTYGAVAGDVDPPTLESKRLDGETLDYGATAETVEFRYADALSGVNASAVRLSFDGRDVTTDGATAITSGTATYRATGLEPGRHAAAVTVVDRAGNADTFESSFTVPEDATAPSLSITSPADGAVFDPGTDSVDLVAAVADGETGLESVRVEFDGADVTSAATVSDGRLRYRAGGLADGTDHEFVVTLVDGAGNERTERVAFSVAEPLPEVRDGAPSGGGGGGGGNVPPPSILTEVDALDDASALVTVRNARPGERVRAKLPPVAANGVAFADVDLALDAKIPRFGLTFAARGTTPDGLPELDGAEPIAALETSGDRVTASDLRSVAVSVRVDRAALPAGATLDDVSLFAYDDGWRRLDATRDGRTFTATAPPLAPLAVAVDEGEPEFVVRDAAVDARTVDVGERITVTATAENVGRSAGSFDVELRADDRRAASESVALAAGESKTVSFAYVPSAEGTVGLSVGGVSVGDVAVVRTVVPADEPAAPPAATEGQPGFGAGLAAVALALAAAALLARRR